MNLKGVCPYSEDHLFLDNKETCHVVCKVIHANIFLGTYEEFSKFVQKAKCKSDYWNCNEYKKKKSWKEVK